jgi:hypothetical protein
MIHFVDWSCRHSPVAITTEKWPSEFIPAAV